MKLEGSPFVFGKIATKPAFINRDEEKKRLINNFVSGINTLLISPRRWGKSSLIKQTALECSRKYKNLRICFIDMYAIRNEQEFYEVLLTEVLKATSSRLTVWIKNAKEFLKNIIPVFSWNIDTQENFQIKLNWQEDNKSDKEILNLPERIAQLKKIRFVICIDEFQKSAKFKNSLHFQQKLRSVWQNQKLCSYVLYGSKRHVIMNLFTSQSMPFYKFGDLMLLQKIDKKHWVPYIMRSFKKTAKSIPKKLAENIVDVMQNHPFYVQQYAHQVWVNTLDKVTPKIFNKALDELMLYNGVMYYRLIDMLSNPQLNLLNALVDGEKQLFSKKILQKYEVGTSANVLRAKQALEKKEIIDFFEKKSFFIDPLFKIWLKKKIFK